MGFQDDLTAETRATHSCKIATIKEKMTAADRKVLDTAMDNLDNVPTEVIIRALNKNPGNPNVGRRVVVKHRDKMCVCFDEAVPS